MEYEIRVPDFGGTDKKKLTVKKLFVAEGDEVEEEERIGTVSTGTREKGLYSPASGVIREMCVEEGDTVQEEDLVAVIENAELEEEDLSAFEQDEDEF